MNKYRSSVLVITIYTKRFGVAVFRDTELLHFAVKTFKAPRTINSIEADTLKEILLLIQEFMPASLVRKTLSKRQVSRERHQLIATSITQIAEAIPLPIEEFSFEEAKQRLVIDNKPTKKNTFAVLGRSYPELSRFVRFQNHSQEEYYTPLLSAVAIGHARQTLVSTSTGESTTG